MSKNNMNSKPSTYESEAWDLAQQSCGPAAHLSSPDPRLHVHHVHVNGHLLYLSLCDIYQQLIPDIIADQLLYENGQTIHRLRDPHFLSTVRSCARATIEAMSKVLQAKARKFNVYTHKMYHRGSLRSFTTLRPIKELIESFGVFTDHMHGTTYVAVLEPGGRMEPFGVPADVVLPARCRGGDADVDLAGCVDKQDPWWLADVYKAGRDICTHEGVEQHPAPMITTQDVKSTARSFSWDSDSYYVVHHVVRLEQVSSMACLAPLLFRPGTFRSIALEVTGPWSGWYVSKPGAQTSRAPDGGQSFRRVTVKNAPYSIEKTFDEYETRSVSAPAGTNQQAVSGSGPHEEGTRDNAIPEGHTSSACTTTQHRVRRVTRCYDTCMTLSRTRTAVINAVQAAISRTAENRERSNVRAAATVSRLSVWDGIITKLTGMDSSGILSHGLKPQHNTVVVDVNGKLLFHSLVDFLASAMGRVPESARVHTADRFQAQRELAVQYMACLAIHAMCLVLEYKQLQHSNALWVIGESYSANASETTIFATFPLLRDLISTFGLYRDEHTGRTYVAHLRPGPDGRFGIPAELWDPCHADPGIPGLVQDYMRGCRGTVKSVWYGHDYYGDYDDDSLAPYVNHQDPWWLATIEADVSSVPIDQVTGISQELIPFAAGSTWTVLHNLRPESLTPMSRLAPLLFLPGTFSCPAMAVEEPWSDCMSSKPDMTAAPVLCLEGVSNLPQGWRVRQVDELEQQQQQDYVCATHDDPDQHTNKKLKIDNIEVSESSHARDEDCRRQGEAGPESISLHRVRRLNQYLPCVSKDEIPRSDVIVQIAVKCRAPRGHDSDSDR